VFLTAAFLLISILPVQDTDRPLPELGPLLKEVRKTLRSDRLLLSQYTYTETQTEHHFDRSGKIKKSEVTVSEVYPSLEEGFTYRRVVVRDGKPVRKEELEKQDREHDKKLAERARKLAREDADDRARREAKEAKERKKEDEAIDEVFAIYDITLGGRDTIDGFDAIRLDFRPRPRVRPKTRGGQALSKVRGQAWFNEQDHQLMRVEAELTDDFTLGFGILAKLNKGAHMQFERTRVNDEIWLPAAARFAGSARIMLLKGMRVEVVSEYSDHRKFTVHTSITYGDEKGRQTPRR
jgi:hypothetical protein